MTEGDRAFYNRRIHEELIKANAPENQKLPKLHLAWALLYQERIEGSPKNVIRLIEARLKEAGYECEQTAASALQVDPAMRYG